MLGARQLALAGMMLIASTSWTSAQIEDPAQRKSWFYLQKLAKDINEIEVCVVLAARAGGEAAAARVLTIYRRNVEEFVAEADGYTKKYSNTRGKNESTAAFRFRVWEVALRAGIEDKKLPDTGRCRAIVGAPL